MKTMLMCLLVLAGLATPAAAQIPGEVSCDKGAEMARVQALVKRTAEAVKRNQSQVIQQINQRDPRWKDGDFYVVILQGTKVLAHGYMPSLAGQDVGNTTYQNTYPWIRSGERVATEQGQGCIEYRFHNPAKGGAVEDKITYVLRVDGDLWVASGTYVIRK